MKKYLLSMVLILCLTGCTKNTDKNVKESTEYSKTCQETVTEKATSVYEYDAYKKLFADAKDSNDYYSKYDNAGGLKSACAWTNKPKDGVITYDGNPIQLELKYEASWDIAWGVLIYLNGIPQKYHTDISDEDRYIHPVSLKKDIEELSKVYFVPNIGNAGDELEMTVVLFCGADYRPLGAHDPLMPEGHPQGASEWCKINMRAKGTGFDETSITDISELTPYTEYELSQLVCTRPDGSIEDKLKEAGFKNINFQRNAIEDGKLHLFTEFGGGYGGGEYIISAYLNGRLLRMYRANCDDWRSRAVIRDDVTFTEDMLKEYDIQDYNLFYYMAVPVSKKINTGMITSENGSVISGRDVLQ